MASKRILISGASVAGPALAYWLGRYGWQPTIVERASELRTAGQNIDIRGAAAEVVSRMGIYDRIRSANTGELGTRFVGPNGQTEAEFPVSDGDNDGPTSALEILRGDLARVLVDLTESDVEYVYGDHITELDNGAEKVDVTFAEGRPRSFDLVVAADGLRSNTRRLVFGDEPTIERLGLYIAYFTIPRDPDDDGWWNWYVLPGSRAVSLRPDNYGTTRAMLSFISEPEGYENLERDGQLEVLRRQFEDAGPVATRVLRGLEVASDMYFEDVGQVHSPTWSEGRVGLVGDAAYCPSPVSAMGTSLALTGAYVLAGELAAHTDHRDAFRGYERTMRSYVDRAQDLAPGVPRVMYPKTGAGAKVLDLALRAVSSPPAAAIGNSLLTPPAESLDLPDYSHLELATRQ